MSLTTMNERPRIYYTEESQGDRLTRKVKETPIFPVAIGTCLGVVGYGVYAFKNRGKMSTSVYLMHLRVGAQGAAVGSLTLGLLHSMINQHLLNNDE
ncbi:hypothetical protein JTB14_005934 [Gonioctena quinquepunctata]|nr:hypothetical protein JTB14_005934 [Gonioctena quinquepunctata]